MPSSSNGDPGPSNPQLAHGTLSSQTSSSLPQSASILQNARNIQINNGVFTTNTTNISAPASPLAILYNSVAPNAILNSGGRADEVRCYPGTREEVIGLVEKSIVQEFNGPRMLWLSGPAGAGKSAIMQTVAERCKDNDVPQANFFFFRADSSRKDAIPFVATIIHQIIQRYPSVEPAVAAALASNPLLFQMDIQHQFEVLLHQALVTLHHTAQSGPPLTLLIDGLDECDSETKTGQRQLLQALDTLLMREGPYFRVIIASRIEPQISMAFGQLRSGVDSIFLDEKYSPEKDIHRFVTAEFDKIKLTHYLASTLDSTWPSEADIAGIVSKSSGQFIFAATVMRFIAYSRGSPILSLQKVQGIVPPTKNLPFAQLDAIYAYILGEVEDWEAVKSLLSIKLLDFDEVIYAETLMESYQPRFSKHVFNSCVSELAPLMNVKLNFFHASLVDFLRDQSRSSEYYINLSTFVIGAIPMWLRDSRRVPILTAIKSLGYVNGSPTPELTAALLGPHTPFALESFRLLDIGTFRLNISIIYEHARATGDDIQISWLSEPLDSVSDILATATRKMPAHKRGMALLGRSWNKFTGKGKSGVQ